MRYARATHRHRRFPAFALWATAALVVFPVLVAAATLKSGDFVMVTWTGGPSPCCRVLSLDAASLAVSEITAGGYIVDPQDVAVRAQGDVLVSVPATGVVRVDPGDGSQSVFTSLEALGGGTPAGILTAGSTIYVTLQGSPARLVQLNADGSFARVVSSGGLLTYPAGLALGPDDALYVCETISFGAYPGGALIRIDPSSGAQSLFASGDPLHGPFDVACAPDGWLWSVQRGYLLHERRGWLTRTRLSDGFSEQVPFGFDFVNGIAIRPDGLTVVADCGPVHSSCEYPFTRIYPDGAYVFSGSNGPIALVPELSIPTPSNTTSWGRLKTFYR